MGFGGRGTRKREEWYSRGDGVPALIACVGAALEACADVAAAAGVDAAGTLPLTSPPRSSGLLARLMEGVPYLLGALPNVSLSFFLEPSLISPPEPAASFSLPVPAWLRECLPSGRGFELFAVSAVSRLFDDFRELASDGRIDSKGAEDGGGARGGDVGLDGGLRG